MTDNTSTPEDSSRRPSRLNPLGSSRRAFLGASAVVSAGAIGAATPIAADSHNDDEDQNEEMEDHGEEMDGDGGDEQGGPSDVDILNFARTLEFLEARFYREGLDTIGESGLCRSEPLQMVDGSVQDDAFGELRVIQEHEEIHAEVLGETIEDLGGEPVAEPEFDFGTATEDPIEFLQTAALLETTGVGAYAGAAPLIENPELIPPALGIHSVEARHTSFLNVLNGDSGFPDAFDEALSMDEVLERANQFIVE
ncbi:ferritin-like domain-containing protein (plasmid) [Haloferacaceae archaeon DSL9]